MMTQKNAQQVVDSPIHLDLFREWWVTALFLRLVRLRLSHLALLAALVGWGSYYFLPMVFAALQGVLISPETVVTQFKPVGLAAVGEWLSRSPSMVAAAAQNAKPILYYASDPIHFVYSLTTLLIGGPLMILALGRFPQVLDELIESGQIQVPAEVLEKEVDRTKQRCRSVVVQMLAFGVSVLLTVAMIERTQDPVLRGWWGHADHGPAGLMFALAAGGMVFGGINSIYLLANGLHTISRLLLFPVILRPFHPDGCNGFGQFGNYLIHLFFLALTIAGSIWITFWGGYLDIEKFFITWIVGAVIILAVPLILITPLVRCTRQISRARLGRVKKVEQILHRLLEDVEAQLGSHKDAAVLCEELKRLLDMRDVVGKLYGSNIFPFKPKIAGTLSLGYLLQVALIVKEAVNNLIA